MFFDQMNNKLYENFTPIKYNLRSKKLSVQNIHKNFMILAV